MNCSEIQERLSEFHDSELPPNEAAQFAAHLADCTSCAEELASFDQLSGLSRRLTDPPVPAEMWDELRLKLDTSNKPRTVIPQIFPAFVLTRRFALAASMLVVVGIGVFTFLHSHSEHDHLAMNFAHYLEEFDESPDNAQQILLAKYNGQPITLEEATNVLGYEPLAAKGLPPGCSLDKAYLLNMPCCTCAQVVCKNEAGQSIAIFEHDIDQPVWFGDNPSVECLCHEIPTNVVQVGDRLAASWKEGQRYVTVIGAKDLDEVTDFVAHLSANQLVQ